MTGFFAYLLAPPIVDSLKEWGFDAQNFSTAFNWKIARGSQRICQVPRSGSGNEIAEHVSQIATNLYQLGITPILVLQAPYTEYPAWIHKIQLYLEIVEYFEHELPDLINILEKPDQSVTMLWSDLQYFSTVGLKDIAPKEPVLAPYGNMLSTWSKKNVSIASILPSEKIFQKSEFIFVPNNDGTTKRYRLKSLPMCGFELHDYQPQPFGFFTEASRVMLNTTDATLHCLKSSEDAEDIAFWMMWQYTKTSGSHDIAISCEGPELLSKLMGSLETVLQAEYISVMSSSHGELAGDAVSVFEQWDDDKKCISFKVSKVIAKRLQKVVSGKIPIAIQLAITLGEQDRSHNAISYFEVHIPNANAIQISSIQFDWHAASGTLTINIV